MADIEEVASSTGNNDHINKQGKSTNENFDFEKIKYGVEILKWLIGSVVLVLIAQSIETSFRDRQMSITEMREYDKYLVDLLNSNPQLIKKIQIAQFYANVTPNDQIRKLWKNYYKELQAEYDSTIGKDLAKLKDSTSSKNPHELAEAKSKIDSMNLIKNTPIVTSATKLDLAKKYEWEGFKNVEEGNIENAIVNFQEADIVYPTFHQVYEISRFLKKNKNLSPNQIKDSLVTRYSYGMPEYFKASFKSQ